MKRIRNLFGMVAALGALTLIASCGPDTPDRPIEEVQLEKLVATWNLSDVTLDGTTKRAEYTNFKLTVAGVAGQTTFSYTTTGSTALLTPWPRTGSWKFGEPVETVIIRMDNPDLPMTYSVTDTQLQISFNFTGNGFQPTRTSQVKGQWVFTFTK
jgi:hypothetical protein